MDSSTQKTLEDRVVELEKKGAVIGESLNELVQGLRDEPRSPRGSSGDGRVARA